MKRALRDLKSFVNPLYVRNERCLGNVWQPNEFKSTEKGEKKKEKKKKKTQKDPKSWSLKSCFLCSIGGRIAVRVQLSGLTTSQISSTQEKKQKKTKKTKKQKNEKNVLF
jgi:hypothetical protein